MAKFNVMDIMGAQSKEGAQKIIKIEQIPFDLITPSAKNLYSMDGVEALAANMQAAGLMQPLRVRMVNGKYEIISGHRRHAAITLLRADGDEWETIPCIVANTSDDLKAELELLLANKDNRYMTDADRVFEAERLREVLLSLKRSGHKFGKRLREQMADMLNVSSSQVAIYERISKDLAPEERTKFNEGELTITEAYDLARGKDAPKEPEPKKAEESKTAAGPVDSYTAAGDTPAAGKVEQAIENGMPHGITSGKEVEEQTVLWVTSVEIHDLISNGAYILLSAPGRQNKKIRVVLV